MDKVIPQGMQSLTSALQSGSWTSVELTQAYLSRIAQHNDNLNIFITVCNDTALAQAEAADQRRAAGDAGPMTGIPYAHKDIFCTRGVKTS